MQSIIAITPGEPAGIGPDIILLLIQQHPVFLNEPLVIIADIDLMQARAKNLGINIPIKKWHPDTDITAATLWVEHVPLIEPTTAQQLNPANAKYVLNTLQRATDGCLQKEFAALVTGPVHKGNINDAGFVFSGHTEWLATASNTKKTVMCLMSPKLKVTLLTTHIPLSEVPKHVTEKNLSETIHIIHHDLQHYFHIKQPHILVCGLNPHAGENGHLGREEIEIIIPTLNTLRKQDIQLIGPVPADTAFIPQQLKNIDCVLAMYHDQGLPVIKQRGFGSVVNVTFGLPFIRTSVDHGTALELAGTDKANPDSLMHAIELASDMSLRN
jgi:4-hydroxythreonine-4-phosphate dehydrogenase